MYMYMYTYMHACMHMHMHMSSASAYLYIYMCVYALLLPPMASPQSQPSPRAGCLRVRTLTSFTQHDVE